MTSRLLTSYQPSGGGSSSGSGSGSGSGNGGGSSNTATATAGAAPSSTLSQQPTSASAGAGPNAAAGSNTAAAAASANANPNATAGPGLSSAPLLKAATPPPAAVGSANGKSSLALGSASSAAGTASKTSGAKSNEEEKRPSGSAKSAVNTSSNVHSKSDGKSASGSGSGSIPRTKTNKYGEEVVIVDVWAKNLKEELDRIMEIVDDYNYIAMDTEFPGIVARPLGCFKNAHDYHYQTLKCNVDLLKIIQLGLTFCNEQGHFLPGTCSWQFNFKFNLSEDMYAQDSVDLLTKSGIDFKEHDAKGIDVEEFGELIMTSGIVLNEDVRWLSFHSGYDYGYLLKLLTGNQPLPKEEVDFFDLLRTYFPIVYDVKYLMKSCENLKGGLQKVAEDLQVERVGPQHQAGSDSLLTAATFFKIRSLFFENQIDDSKYAGVLYGLGQQLRSKNANKNLENADGTSA